MANADLNVKIALLKTNFEAGIASLKKELGGLKAANTQADSAGGLPKTRAGLQSISTQLATAKTQFLQLVGAASAFQAVAGLIKAADTYKQFNAQLKLATRSQAELAIAQADVARIANGTNNAINETAKLYAKLNGAVRNYGGNQKDTANITEAVALSLKVSGATAAESASAILQFSQAMGSGVLRGEEFNAVNEASPRLMQALADSLNVPKESLRGLAESGALTSDVVGKALPAALAQLRQEAAQIPPTVGGAFQVLSNNIVQAIGQFDATTGASATLAAGILALSNNLNVLAAAVAAVVGILAGRYISGLLAARSAANALAVAQTAAAAASARASTLTLGLSTAQTGAAASGALLAGRFALLGRGLLTLVGGIPGLIIGLGSAALAFLNLGDSGGNALDKLIAKQRELNGLKKEDVAKFGESGAVDINELKRLQVENQKKLESVKAAPRAFAVDPVAQQLALQSAQKRVQEGAEAIRQEEIRLAQAKKESLELDKQKIEAQAELAKAPAAALQALRDRNAPKSQQNAVALKNELADYEKLASKVKGLTAEEKARDIALIKAKFAEKDTAKNPKAPKFTATNIDSLAEIKRQSDAQFDIENARIENEKAANDRAFEAKKISLQAYFDAKAKLEAQDATNEEKRLNAESDALKAQRKELKTINPKNDDDKARIADKISGVDSQITDLEGRIKVLQVNAIGAQAKVADDRLKAEQDVLSKQADAVKSVEDKIAALNREAAALDLTGKAAKTYADEQERAAILEDVVATGVGKSVKVYKRLNKELQDAQSGKDAAQARVDVAEKEAARTQQIYENFQKGLQDSLAQSLDDLATGQTGDFLNGVLTTIRRAAGQAIAAAITKSITDSLGGQDGVVGILDALGFGGAKGGAKSGEPNSTAQGVEQAAATGIIAGAQGSAGVFTNIFSQGASILQTVFNGLANALSGLFNNIGSLFSGGGAGGGFLSAIGGLFGFASGGYTGDGGKYQPKGIVHGGEFVFSKAAVARLGLGFLNNLHQTASGARLPTMPRLAYADGGLVNLPSAQAPATNLGLNIVNAVDPGVTHDHMQTPAGQRTIINVIKRNSGTIRQELGL